MTYAHRLGSCEVTVLRSDGTPAAGCPVTVEQVRHAFGFGNIGFDLIALANGEDRAPDGVFGGASAEHGEHLAALWLDLFDTATLPFYWAGFEPVRGTPDTARLQRAARWFVERGVRVKGHPLVWHTLTPPWLSAVPDDEVEEALRARVTREVGDFAGLVDQWDAINEVVILPVFTAEENAVTRLAQRLGRVEMVRLAFSSARAADPTARLVLNDFDLGPDYERLVEECLAAGIAIDAIGLQTHMHQGYRGEDQVLAIVDRFARFGLPLQLTETTLLSGDLMPAHIVDLNDYQVPSWPSTPAGEARQADEVVRHYRSLVGHPAVESITYWGLTDEGSWLGAPAGLVRADGTPKPAYDALHGLVRGEWWMAPTSMRTDEAGRLVVRGYAGEYRLTVPHGPTAELALTAAGSTATLTL
jgi:GH35 family endo-1,4-beta-xylanase